MISLAFNAAYAVVAALTAPWWMRKARGGWPERFGRIQALPEARRPRLLIHAVSVGEVNLTQPLVAQLEGEFDLVVSVSTDTGIARARALYDGAGVRVVRYPLDASWSVRRFLDAVRPNAVALVELELWPNFARACARRGIPLSVINGRLSERSFKRYRRGRFLIGRYFRQLAHAAVQDEVYAQRFGHMGVAPDRLSVAGSMKWDSAQVSDSVDGPDALASLLGIDHSRPLIVAGSTAQDEHELLMRATPGNVQLLCAPRRPEWFDEAAGVLEGCVRRSERTESNLAGPPSPPSPTGRYLLDSIGELRQAYALADVIVIGRSFGELYGSDPMEAAALGKPVVIGPRVSDFASIVETMDGADAIVRTTRDGLGDVLDKLIADPDRRRELGDNARQCVLDNQGAAQRHADILRRLMRAEAQS